MNTFFNTTRRRRGYEMNVDEDEPVIYSQYQYSMLSPGSKARLAEQNGATLQALINGRDE